MKYFNLIFVAVIAAPQSGLAFEGGWNIPKAEEATLEPPASINGGPKGMAYNGVPIIDSIPRDRSFATRSKLSAYEGVESMHWANYDGGNSDNFYGSFSLRIRLEGGGGFSLSPRLHFNNSEYSSNHRRPGEHRPPYYGWDNLEDGYKPLADTSRQCIQKIEQFMVDLSNGSVEPELANLFFSSIRNRPDRQRPHAMYFNVTYEGQGSDRNTPKIASVSLYENYHGKAAHQVVDENGDCDPKKLVEDFAVVMGTVQHEPGTINYGYDNDGIVSMEEIRQEGTVTGASQ